MAEGGAATITTVRKLRHQVHHGLTFVTFGVKVLAKVKCEEGDRNVI